MADNHNLLQFPCNFPIKIMGKAGFEFESSVLTIIRRHIPHLAEGAITLKPSKQGNYLSITAIVHVENQVQLDNLYRDLVACEWVLMVL